MQSNLYFWGHNCFHIDHASTFLVTDPWLTPKGAFAEVGSSIQRIINNNLN